MGKTLEISPLKDRTFGAVVSLPDGVTDPYLLNDEDFATLKDALLRNLVLVVKNQKDLPPSSQHKLTARFDPSCKGNYGHDVEKFRHKDSVLRRDGWSVPSTPEVQILGQGNFKDYHGIPEISLRHPIHDDFHKSPLSEEEKEQNLTRFYRWHMDSALYALKPPICTTLLGIRVPPATHSKFTIKYDDGTNDELSNVSQAATAFVNSSTSFDELSDEDKEFVLNHNIVYAPHPYIFISPAKATSNGLTMVSEGKEMSLDKLPEWKKEEVKTFPMVWKNPVTDKPHFQVHGCCVWRIEDKKGNVVLELEEARKKLEALMRPGISSKNVYAHNWEEGDLVIFYNRGLWHSVTGHFKPGETRIMHQCNIASGEDPIPFVL